MPKIDTLQHWLRRRMSRAADPVLPDWIDLPKRSEVRWQALEDVPGWRQAEAHARWAAHGYLEAFLASAYRLLRAGIGARWRRDRVIHALDVLVVAGVHGTEVESDDISALAALELTTIGHKAQAPLLGEAVTLDDLGAWARAVRLLDADGEPTPVARAFLSLVGREALQFVLELEVALSTGVADDQRVSRRTLEVLRDRGVTYGGYGDEPPHSYGTMKRLAELGVAEHDETSGVLAVFSLSPDAVDLVASVLDPEPNPYRALVHALLDAERGRVTTAITGVAGAPGTDLAYVRMVVHELRNATLPLSNALSRLWIELGRPDGPDAERVTELRERVDRSMGRLSEFARDSARLAAAISIESFSLRDIVEEAIAATETDRNGRILVLIEEMGDATIEGARGRWNLLFVNLFRNAAQSRAGKGRVRVRTDWALTGALHVFVDDDGPGVPVELRERIFELGVSTRGGSGLGLHDARITVLQSQGTLTCEESPEGGARFHIAVPARRRD